jgi:hypothetical protein
MNKRTATLVLTMLFVGLTQSTHAQTVRDAAAAPDSGAQDNPISPSGTPAAARAEDYNVAEKDLNATAEESAPAGKEAVIETSHPYLLPRLFTLPTAYSLQSYEVRFGGQGNIHSTFANMNTEAMKASVSMGFGGIMELGYQLDEYYTVQDISDKILMGYFKLSLLKESKYLPAAAISASKNLRTSFHTTDSYSYKMNEDMYEVVFSKAFRIGDDLITLHPGAQIIRDEVESIDGLPRLAKPLQATKFNPRLGVSWQSRPKTLFMYEFKLLNPTDVSSLGRGGIGTHTAMENNLGIRYYIRNWLCIDSGIRHFYDLEKRDDEMKLHANFVGVIPLATVYDRVQNYFKK